MLCVHCELGQSEINTFNPSMNYSRCAGLFTSLICCVLKTQKTPTTPSTTRCNSHHVAVFSTRLVYGEPSTVGGWMVWVVSYWNCYCVGIMHELIMNIQLELHTPPDHCVCMVAYKCVCLSALAKTACSFLYAAWPVATIPSAANQLYIG